MRVRVRAGTTLVCATSALELDASKAKFLLLLALVSMFGIVSL